MNAVDDALRVGDLMRMSVELIDALKADPLTRDVLVRVRRIEANDDGTKTLWLENAPAPEAK